MSRSRKLHHYLSKAFHLTALSPVSHRSGTPLGWVVTFARNPQRGPEASLPGQLCHLSPVPSPTHVLGTYLPPRSSLPAVSQSSFPLRKPHLLWILELLLPLTAPLISASPPSPRQRIPLSLARWHCCMLGLPRRAWP